MTWKEEKDNEGFKAMGKDEDGNPIGRGRPQWAIDMVAEFEEENALLG